MQQIVDDLHRVETTFGDHSHLNQLRARARGLSGVAQSLCGGQSVATSGRWFAEPSQTLLFFDWDDTLFPTEELFHRWMLPTDAAEWDQIQLTERQHYDLQRWEDALYQFLCIALAKSERLVIVTNSRRPWVTDCVDCFAPRLKPLFQKDGNGPRVVYAREVFESKTRAPAAADPMYVDGDMTRDEIISQLTCWKFQAMKSEASAFYSKYRKQTWKNILSVGDMPYEHLAVQDLGMRRQGPSRERLRTKSVIFPQKMSISWMTMAWQWWKIALDLYVRYDGDFTLDVSDKPGLDRIALHADILQVPELAALDCPPQVINGSGAGLCPIEEEDEQLSTALTDLAVVVQTALEY